MSVSESDLELRFCNHSVLESIKQKYFNFLMLGVSEMSYLYLSTYDFSLADNKKLRHFYVLTKYPLV